MAHGVEDKAPLPISLYSCSRTPSEASLISTYLASAALLKDRGLLSGVIRSMGKKKTRTLVRAVKQASNAIAPW